MCETIIGKGIPDRETAGLDLALGCNHPPQMQMMKAAGMQQLQPLPCRLRSLSLQPPSHIGCSHRSSSRSTAVYLLQQQQVQPAAAGCSSSRQASSLARSDRRDSTVCQAAADAAGEGRGAHIVIIAAARAPAAVSTKPTTCAEATLAAAKVFSSCCRH